MADAFARVLKLLPSLSPEELVFLIRRARDLGGVTPSTVRWRKHAERVGTNAGAPVGTNSTRALVQTLSDNVVPDSSSVSSNKNLRAAATEVLHFLNEKTSRNYRDTDTNLRLIEARLRSGASVQDCKSVIGSKMLEWKSDAEMNRFLRPATLFNATKFEQYLGALGERDAK